MDARGSAAHYGYREADEGQFEKGRDVDYVTGASLAISRTAYEAIGELDESFGVAYYEDVDWCYRARAAGFGVLYAPKAVLVHKESGAGVPSSHEGYYRFHRNRLRFVLKHWETRRLLEDFSCAECVWLEGLQEGGERLIAAVHHAYLYHLLHIDVLVASRSGAPGTNSDDADAIAATLLKLRTTLPLTPARSRAEPPPSREGREGSSWADLLGQLHQLQVIRERPARSRLPVVGRLLSALRRPWNQAVTAAYVLPMVHQQTEFNALVVALLDEVTQYRLSGLGRLDEVLVEYLREAARELGELAQEVQRLRTLVEEQRPRS